MVRSTDLSILNLFVSDASDTHAFIYRADRVLQLVREFEFSKEESSASVSACIKEELFIDKQILKTFIAFL